MNASTSGSLSLYRIEHAYSMLDMKETALVQRAVSTTYTITVGPAVLNAQLQVENFYARLGFVAKGDVFQEAGIDHVRMVRSV